MTVAELIEELQEAPQGAQVTLPGGGECGEVVWLTEHDGRDLRVKGVELG